VQRSAEEEGADDALSLASFDDGSSGFHSMVPAAAAAAAGTDNIPDAVRCASDLTPPGGLTAISLDRQVFTGSMLQQGCCCNQHARPV
jgi:hypothetical protein